MKTRCPQTGQMIDFDKLRAAYEHRCQQVRLSAENSHRSEIERICGRHELESDEFHTREQKAKIGWPFY